MGRRKKTNPTDHLILKFENTNRESCAFSRDFATAQITDNQMTKWSKTQKQLFMLVLENIDWTRMNNKNVIELDHREVAEKLNWDYAEENERKIAYVLEKEIDFMCKHSYIKLKDPISHAWYSDNVISSAGSLGSGSNFTYVKLSPLFMNHFQGMYQLQSQFGGNFPLLMSTDVFAFRSGLTYDFFMTLRLDGKPGKINVNDYSTFDLKEIFHLTNEAYTKKVIDPKTGEKVVKFDRTNFEKYTLNIVLEDINRSETIKIIPAKDGKLYEKIKVKGKVISYRIKYKILTLQQIRANRRKFEENATSQSEDVIEIDESMYAFFE